MILTLRTADTDDVILATALLYRALLASTTDRLLGSATTSGPVSFTEVVTTSLCLGRVDLAVSGDRIDGVACWINHHHGPITGPATARRTGIDDLLKRMHLIDLIVPVPPGHPHQHLACLGTRPGHQARAITDLLLHRQTLLNKDHGRTFYTEVHDQGFQAWLLRSGYHDHGISLGTDADPISYLLSHLGT